MPVREFLNYWPLHVGEGARAWIDANIKAAEAKLSGAEIGALDKLTAAALDTHPH